MTRTQNLEIQHIAPQPDDGTPIHDAGIDDFDGANATWHEEALTEAGSPLQAVADFTTNDADGDQRGLRYHAIRFTGSLTATALATLPDNMKGYWFWNDTTGDQDITIETPTGVTTLTLKPDQKMLVHIDDSNEPQEMGGAGDSVKVTSTDTTPGLLDEKLVVAGDLEKTVINGGSNEDLELTGILPAGYITGLAIVNNGTDPSNDIDHAVGEARDSGDSLDATLAAVLTKQLDAAWAEGDDAGGLFSGSMAASTWYTDFLIRKTTDGAVDAGFDSDSGGANKPAGWAVMRRLGAVLTDAASPPAIRGFTSIAEHGSFLWDDPSLDITVADQSTTEVLRTLSVPPGIRVKAMIRVRISHASAQRLLLIRSPDTNDEAPSAAAAPLLSLVTGAGGEEAFGTFEVYTNASGQIATRSDGAATDLDIVTIGWQEAPGLGSQGAGGVGSSKILIEEIIASADADVRFVTGIDSAHDRYEIEFIDVQPSTDAAAMQLAVSEDAGSTWKAGASDYEHTLHFLYVPSTGGFDGSTAETFIPITGNIDIGDAASGNADGILTFIQPASASLHKRVKLDTRFFNNDVSQDTNYMGWGKYKGSTNPINGFRLKMSAGNINGTFRLWGLPKS